MKSEIEKIKMSQKEFDEFYEIQESTSDISLKDAKAMSTEVEEEQESQFLTEEEREIDDLLEAPPEGADIT